MIVAHSPTQLRQLLRLETNTVLVPTMGGLHEGHLSLVKHAKTLGSPVVVSIYVNPLQFSPGEDFNEYPRRLEKDCQKLAGLADIVYAPSNEDMYPEKQTITISLPDLANQFCGKSRPGFFHGVCLVVNKLFNQVCPATAIFGQKDYQQMVLIRQMVSQLAIPINISTVPTIREENGLAMSSRNDYLTEGERQIAPLLYHTLEKMAKTITRGEINFEKISVSAQRIIESTGMRFDYFVVRAANTLTLPEKGKPLVILAAAWLGKTRLIDNILIDSSSTSTILR